MPAYRRRLLIALALGVVAATFRSEIAAWFETLLPKTATIRLIDEDEQTIPLAGRADIFELDRTRYLPSPQPSLGSVELAGSGELLTLDANAFPKSLQVRFHVPGYGVDYASVELGRRREFRLRLGKPTTVRGVIRDAAGAPLPAARVLALGMHQRGVILAETESTADGVFALEGISSRVDSIVLRVLKEGFSMQEREHVLKESAIERVRNTAFDLTPVPPAVGVITLPEDCPTDGLVVSLFCVPGISAPVDEHGGFVMHSLDRKTRYRLLLRGLPTGFAHGPVYAGAGARVKIDVVKVAPVRGRVVSSTVGAVANARISHRCSTRGDEVVLTDGNGRFSLDSVPCCEHIVKVELPHGGVEEHAVLGGEAGEVMIQVR